ncbi:hypothetical protein DICPUDRAFT_93261, partial [Dictyostelium purpureum]
MINILKLVFIFLLFISITRAYEIIIDYNQNNLYYNSRCGGAIDVNDHSVYPTCNSIKDAANRSRMINRNSFFNSSIIFYLIGNDYSPITIKDENYFDKLDFFEKINIVAIYKNKTIIKTPRIIISGELAKNNFLTT